MTVAVSPDGQWMAVGGSLEATGDGAIKLWSTKTWSEVKSLSNVGDYPHAVAFSPDSRRLVAGHHDDEVRVWEVATGTLRTLSGHKKAVEDVAFSPDGRLIASASRDMTIRIWDADTYEPRSTLRHERPVFGLAFHPRGRQLASSTGDIVDSSRGDLTLWDVDSARVVRKTSALASMFFSIRFSPNGRRLATAGWDGVVRIWDATTLNELLPLTGHAEHVRWVTFSQDGDQLASGGNDGRIRCWNAAPLPERLRHQPASTFSGHKEAVHALALTTNDSRLISAGKDHTAHVWDVETGRDLLTYATTQTQSPLWRCGPTAKPSPAGVTTRSFGSGAPGPVPTSASSAATPAASPRWRSTPMASGWPRRATTARSGCGIRARASRFTSSSRCLTGLHRRVHTRRLSARRGR